MSQQNKSLTALGLRVFTIHFYKSRTALELGRFTIQLDDQQFQ